MLPMLFDSWYSSKRSPATVLYKLNRSPFCRPVMPQRLDHASTPCKLVGGHTKRQSDRPTHQENPSKRIAKALSSLAEPEDRM